MFRKQIARKLSNFLAICLCFHNQLDMRSCKFLSNKIHNLKSRIVIQTPKKLPCMYGLYLGY